MPKKRQPREIWRETRRKVWLRDGGICQSPLPSPLCIGKDEPMPLTKCHIDHIKSGKLGTNELSNLRVLCPVCHALRADERHRALTTKMLQKNAIPGNWRELVWED